ncbi:phosphoribosyltransferase [Hydrogenimonas urashimensis]|uniref:phosphoribosyltransferase n=1 Tax=Hydrogenimonas urashimensis TaxID=2740515 RepID=UPI001915B3C0|nr:phosphoribosyltransferase family protein [Hydrogenimonas urashimensis]
MKRVRYDYETFVKDLKQLADSIPDSFNAIVAIARGGMTMAHLLGEYWNIRNVFVINSIGYEETRKLEKTKVFNIPDLLPCDDILIVDDIADSGETIKAVLDTLKARYPDKRFKTATLFFKPNKSIVRPDYWLKEVDDEWIDFFWSDDLKALT